MKTPDERAEELASYLKTMDEADAYSPDFRDGFRHALALTAAYSEERVPGRVRPETREAARMMLEWRRERTT